MINITYILVLVVITALLYIIIPYIILLIIRYYFSRKAKKRGRILLTFDDGPDPNSTPQILDILKKHNIKAIFFLSGDNVAKYGYIVEKIVEDGHLIGEHGFNHIHPWKSSPINSVIDIRKGEKILKRFYKKKQSCLFRPPYGKLNILQLTYVLLKRKEIFLWTIDPKDYNAKSGKEIYNFIKNNMFDGGIVLLHDGRRGEKSNSSSITINSLEMIIKLL